MNRDEMERLTADAASLSEKIRILHDARVPKAEIATFLERRYQHVYNVIKDYETRRAGGAPVQPAANDEVISLTLGTGGTLQLPSGWLEAQNLQPGDPVFCRTDPRGLVIMSRTAATEAVLELASRHMPGEAALLGALLFGATEKP